MSGWSPTPHANASVLLSGNATHTAQAGMIALDALAFAARCCSMKDLEVKKQEMHARQQSESARQQQKDAEIEEMANQAQNFKDYI